MIGNNFIDKSRDYWLFSDEYILSKLPRYFSLYSKDEMLVFKESAGFYSAINKVPMKSLTFIIKLLLNNGITYADLYIGSYLWLDRDKLETAIDLQDNMIEAEIEYSQYAFEYLQKMVNLCNAHNIELILINSPTYNSEKYGNKTMLMNYLNNYFPNIKYLDFSDFDMPEYGYGDINHLNYKGAEIFSSYLQENYNDL